MRNGIDLVVVNYRTPYDLEAFLWSLVTNRPTLPWSLTIVNVDPLVADEEAAREFPLPYNYWEFSNNVGYARAVNHGAYFGDRETLAIFNADTRLLGSVATDCHYALQSHSDWGIVGPRQIDNAGKITHGGFCPNERGFHQPDSGQFTDIRDDALTVSGSAYFIKRNVWNTLTECPLYSNSYPEATGAFLPTQHYFEETWCSYHARAHGYKVVYYGASTMIHQWHKASARGGSADKNLPASKLMFKEACLSHGISESV